MKATRRTWTRDKVSNSFVFCVSHKMFTNSILQNKSISSLRGFEPAKSSKMSFLKSIHLPHQRTRTGESQKLTCWSQRRKPRQQNRGQFYSISTFRQIEICKMIKCVINNQWCYYLLVIFSTNSNSFSLMSSLILKTDRNKFSSQLSAFASEPIHFK